MKKIDIYKTMYTLLIFMTIVCIVNAQTKSSKIDELFSYYNENGMFNGTVLVAENGEITLNKTYGFSDFENKIPLGGNSVFDIGSITKTYTATAIMMLKERGLLSYDDKLSTYFSEFPKEATSITLRNLLTHTSGIPDFRSGNFSLYRLPLITNELALDLLVNNFQLEFNPGEKYYYSNSNYFLLAMIIEKISGKSYPDFLKENILIPSGMNNTYVADEFTDFIPNRINAYTYYWNKTEYDLQDRVSGHGNIYSTIYDQYLFDQALYSDKLVKQKTLSEAFDFNQFIDSKRGYRYGLGWRIEGKDSSSGIVSHRGSIGGFKSLLWRDTINKNTLIILSNNWWLVNIPEIINGSQNIMQGKQYDLAKISIQAFFLDNWYMYGFDAAENKMQNVITEKPDKYNYKEDLLNDLAYFFFYREDDSAMNIIDFALEIYPNSANLWDSKGEMSMKFRDKQTAINSFEQSLKLNPDNENAKQMIERIKLIN